MKKSNLNTLGKTSNSPSKPSLSDSDMVTVSRSRRPGFSTKNSMLTTVAIALSLTGIGTTATSCSDNSDCDSDFTRFADPYADAFDVGPTVFDITDADYSSSGDAKICD